MFAIPEPVISGIIAILIIILFIAAIFGLRNLTLAIFFLLALLVLLYLIFTGEFPDVISRIAQEIKEAIATTVKVSIISLAGYFSLSFAGIDINLVATSFGAILADKVIDAMKKK